jgi:site-specific DNA-methyltransferase (adenine-specific)
MEKKNKEDNMNINKNKVNTYNFILGDCIEKLKELDDKSIDIVVTSPPYNIGIKYSKYEDKKPREQYLEWIYDIFTELKRVLKDDGNIFLNMGYTNRDPWISMEVALKLRDLFVMQNKITWVKSISIGEDKDDTHGHFKPINSDRYINVTNEDIYHFTKTDKVKINREAVGVPYKWKCNLIDRKTGKHRINKKTGLPVEDKRCKGNSWFVPYETINSKKEKGYHPATFPEGLVEHCIKISDVKEGVILDPFIGSGTTVRMAKKMTDKYEEYNLSGIGIDIDEKYINYCNESIVD